MLCAKIKRPPTEAASNFIRLSRDSLGLCYLLYDYVASDLAKGLLVPVMEDWLPRLSGFLSLLFEPPPSHWTTQSVHPIGEVGSRAMRMSAWGQSRRFECATSTSVFAPDSRRIAVSQQTTFRAINRTFSRAREPVYLPGTSRRLVTASKIITPRRLRRCSQPRRRGRSTIR